MSSSKATASPSNTVIFVRPFPLVHLHPYKSNWREFQILRQAKLRLLPSLAPKNEERGKYLDLKTLATSYLGLDRKLHPCLANSEIKSFEIPKSHSTKFFRACHVFPCQPFNPAVVTPSSPPKCIDHLLNIIDNWIR